MRGESPSRGAGNDDGLHPVSERFAELSRLASQVIVTRIEPLPHVAMVDMTGPASP